jgi:hypothetical protein
LRDRQITTPAGSSPRLAAYAGGFASRLGLTIEIFTVSKIQAS